MATLVFPPVWDWYLQWREQRRGFFTKWEADMLALLTSLVKVDTGWIRQTPSLADRLKPIAGLISEADIAVAKSDWGGTCDAMYRHARQRLKEIQRVARVHRDPFEPILPISGKPLLDRPLVDFEGAANLRRRTVRKCATEGKAEERVVGHKKTLRCCGHRRAWAFTDRLPVLRGRRILAGGNGLQVVEIFVDGISSSAASETTAGRLAAGD